VSRHGSVAIVGMACVFPGAPDLETYWRNLQAGVDAITDLPDGRWDPVFYDPSSTAADRFYCRRGGFVDAFATFDPLRYGIMPAAAQGAEPDQLLALEVAAQALADAGYDSRPFRRDRTGVILGRGGYFGPGLTRLEQHVRGGLDIVVSLRCLMSFLCEE
jgi:acyl transferase domain-containing protein